MGRFYIFLSGRYFVLRLSLHAEAAVDGLRAFPDTSPEPLARNLVDEGFVEER